MDPEIEVAISGPVIYVYESDDTYDSMYKERQSLSEVTTKSERRHKTPLGRIISDLLGGMFIYFGTFILCDLIRTVREGQWTPLYWSIWGPWRYVTGAPLVHWVKQHIGRDPISCQEGYDAMYQDCYMYDLEEADHDHEDNHEKEGREAVIDMTNALIAMGFPIAYDYGNRSAVDACYSIADIYLIRCQNKGIQGDTKEAICQRQADQWLINTLANATSDYYVERLLQGWLDAYNTCLAPPDRPDDPVEDPPSHCDDVYSKCMESKAALCKAGLCLPDTEKEYVCNDMKLACEGDYDSIDTCGPAWDAFNDCWVHKPIGTNGNCDPLFLDAISCSANTYVYNNGRIWEQ